MVLLIRQTIFIRLPERLNKSQSTKSRAQRKRQKSPTKRDDSRGSPSNQNGISHNSYEHLPQTNSSVDSQSSIRATESIDLTDSPSLSTPPNPQSFIIVPETSTYSNFARFLGPDSIEDVFGQQHGRSRSFISPNSGSTAMDLPQDVVSLDQYVSTLDLQNGRGCPHNINNSAGEMSSLHCGRSSNTAIDDADQPFIPLSPYIMQMHPGSGHFVLSPEPYTLFADDYYMVDTNADSQGT